MTRRAPLLTALLMMAAPLAGCGPSAGDNPAQLFLAIGSDELHAQLVAKLPPHY